MPRRSVAPGNDAGLSIMLNVEKAEYYCTGTESVGFKVVMYSVLRTNLIFMPFFDRSLIDLLLFTNIFVGTFAYAFKHSRIGKLWIFH